MNGRTLGALSVAAAAAIWGFVGLPIRALGDAGLSSEQMNWIRCIIAAAAVGVFLLIVNRDGFKIKKKDLWLFVLAAGCNVFMDTLYGWCQMRIELSSASVLLSTQCFFAMFISLIFFKVRISPLKVFCALAGIFGCALVVGAFSGTGELDALGILAGVGASLLGACYTASYKGLMERKYDPTACLFFVYLLGALLLTPICDPIRAVSASFSGWEIGGNLLILAFVFTMLPQSLNAAGIKRLEIGTAVILLFIETVAASVAGWLFFEEELNAFNLLGIVLVFFAVTLLGKCDRSDDPVEG